MSQTSHGIAMAIIRAKMARQDTPDEQEWHRLDREIHELETVFQQQD